MTDYPIEFEIQKGFEAYVWNNYKLSQFKLSLVQSLRMLTWRYICDETGFETTSFNNS